MLFVLVLSLFFLRMSVVFNVQSETVVSSRLLSLEIRGIGMQKWRISDLV